MLNGLEKSALNEKESSSIYFLDAAVHDLSEIIEDEDLLEEIKLSLPVAKALIEKLLLDEERKDISITESLEAALLLLSVANRWRKLSSDNYGELKHLSRIMAQIYPREVRERKPPHEVFQAYSIFPGVVPLLIAEAFPECWLDIYGKDVSVQDAKAKYIAMAKEERSEEESKIYAWALEKKVEDGLLLLPFEKIHGKNGYLSAMKNVHEELSVPEGNRIMFKAVAELDNNFIIISLKNTSEDTVAHERNHIKYPGMTNTSMGSALNEGMTEYLAQKKLHPNRSELSRMINRVFGTYGKERKLLELLSRKNPKLRALLENRYKLDSAKNSQNLSGELIKTFGLDIYLDLYLANPDAKKMIKKYKKDQIVMISVDQVYKKILMEEVLT